MTKLIVPKNFVSLHSHSGFSTYDGLDSPTEHIDFVKNNGSDAWALTDHGHMNSYATAFLHTKKINAAGANFKFIPGCEMYLHPDLNQWKQDFALHQAAKAGEKAAKKKIADEKEGIISKIIMKTDEDDDPVALEIDLEKDGLTIEDEDESKSAKFFNPLMRRHHLVVIPKTSEGLQRLFGLVSQGYSDGFYRFPRIDYAMLKKAAEGGHLLISSACMGGNLAFEVFSELQNHKIDNLESSLYDIPGIKQKILSNLSNTYDKMVDAVGYDSAFLELQFNKIPAQHLLNRAILDFATERGLNDKLIVTCDSHYASPTHWREREIYKKLGWMNKREFDPSMIPNSPDELKCELYPKNSEQIWETYKNLSKDYDFYQDQEIANAIERTHGIAHDFIGTIEPDTSMKLPSYVIPEGMTADKALLEECKSGLIRRGLEKNKEYIERLKYELGVIKEKKFSQYFLTMKKIIDVAWRSQIVGPGRGSGAGSLVNYVLGITNIDPIKYNLLFERFLDPSRTEFPDIDTDVSQRDELIVALRNEFSDENVIPISNYNMFKLKSLIKDVSKFYGVEFQEVNKAIASLTNDVRLGRKNDNIEGIMDITLEEAFKYSPSTTEFLNNNPQIREPLKVLFKQNKALGRHAGGVIVSENIKQRMPLIKSKGELQTPWVEGMTAKHLEPFGWVKFDLLGLETLRIIEGAIKLILIKNGVKNPDFNQIKAWFQENLDPEIMDLNDQKVYRHVYHEGRFAGIFQCSQRGAQKLFMNAKPESIIDIATLTSIYRPGPLSAHVDKTYIKAKREPESVDYGHPLIKQVLESTYGHIIFQEQAMSLCHVVAGIPKLELNMVRKMMKPGGSGENVEKAKKLKERFINGSISNGVSKEAAEKLYENILYFSGYGFNLSHAASYSIVSYYCAWFLTYYEEEWLSAYLDAMSSDPDKLSKAIDEVKGLGYKLSKVDINTSGTHWTCSEEKVLVPSFSSCKGIGDAAVHEIMENRPYSTLNDLLWNHDGTWKHSKLNKRVLSTLIQLRALDTVDWKDTFDSYKQMHGVLIDNWDQIKKTNKKDPMRGPKTLKELSLLSEDKSEWSIKDLAQNNYKLLGTLNLDTVLSQEFLDRLKEKEVESIDNLSDDDSIFYWFMVSDVVHKKTKNGKSYILLNAFGNEGTKNRMFVWGTNENSKLDDYTICIAQIKNGDFGLSTQWNKVIKI